MPESIGQVLSHFSELLYRIVYNILSIIMSMRRDPFEQMDRMIEQMRRVMGGETMFADFPAVESTRRDANLSLESDEDGYVVVADLPGFEKEEIALRFDDGLLTIDAAHEVSDGSEGRTSWRSRRVHEEMRVPGAVVEDEITASYRNGVLEIHLPVEEDTEEDEGFIPIE